MRSLRPLGQFVSTMQELPLDDGASRASIDVGSRFAPASKFSRRTSHHHPCRVSAAFVKAGLTDRLARFGELENRITREGFMVSALTNMALALAQLICGMRD